MRHVPRLLASALLVVIWAQALSGFGGAGTLDFFGRWMHDAVILVAAAGCLAGATRRGPDRIAWLALAAGLFANLAGDIICSLAPDLDAVPVPSASEPFWLAIYPCLYVAVIALIRSRIGRTLWATRVDGLVGGLAITSLLAYVTVSAAVDGSQGAPFWESATNLAYPVGDLVLLGAIVSAVGLAGWRIDRPLGDPGRRDHRARDGGRDLHDGPGRRPRRRHRRRPDRHRHGGLHLGRHPGAARSGHRSTPPRRPRPVRPGRVRGARAHGARARGAAARQRRGGRARRRGARARPGADGRGAAREPLAARQQPHRGRHRPADRAEQPAQPRDRPRGRPARGHAARPPAARPQRVQGLQRQLRPRRGGHPAPPARRGARAGRRPRRRIPHRRRRVLRARAARRGPRGVLRALRGRARHPRGRLHDHGCPRGGAPAGRGAGPRCRARARRRAHVRPQERRPATRRPAVGRRPDGGARRARAGSGLARQRGARAPCQVAAELGLTGCELEALRHAASLHDIGKMAIPESILEKREPLSDSELALIRRHTIVGERILAAAPALERSARLVRSSHERVDGQGYPDGLAAADIPLGSRIILVADAFDAMRSERSYGSALSEAGALAELRRCAGTQFDATVVAAFERVIARHGVPVPLASRAI